MSVAIIGSGTVGNALAKAMHTVALGPGSDDIRSDVVVICVPTPTVEGKQDISAVYQALGRIKEAKLVILRSTVLPGTTYRLQNDVQYPLMFVPEWGFEATMDHDIACPSYYILGYTEKSKDRTWMAKGTLPSGRNCQEIPAIAAEYSKYFANIWGVSQVMLANSLYDWVGDPKTYEQAIGAMKLHKNIPQWGWNVSDQGGRGAGGKCLPKDLRAALSQFPHPLWMTFKHYNDNLLHESGKS